MIAQPFENSYASLPERFHARLAPAPAPNPQVIAVNTVLADELGLKLSQDADELAALFSGNDLPSSAQPLAMVYAGHQFGQFNPQLGDGRALLLGEVVDASGKRRDVQLKGSGRTPFSRNGDGLAALGPVLREYILSEAMHALGVPTTRALAAVTTGGRVQRETGLPGAVFTRVAASHLRVGTFQYFAARQDIDALQRLTDYAIARHYPSSATADNPALALLKSVGNAQANLIAHWMQIGFIHGVMNTDNFTISGETIDYGPCAFLDEYNPAKVFSSIDAQGRYAYRNQPEIAQWNLARLAEALLPLIASDPDQAVALAVPIIEGFGHSYDAQWLARFRGKIGLTDTADGDKSLIAGFLGLLTSAEADFTRSFASLTRHAGGSEHEEVTDLPGFNSWYKSWSERQSNPDLALMRASNPVIVPRNHLVEAAIGAAVTDGDFTPFHALVKATNTPFDPAMANAPFSAAPAVSERVLQTFCGT